MDLLDDVVVITQTAYKIYLKKKWERFTPYEQ